MSNITSLADRRQQENLAWQSNAVVADYLVAYLAGDKDAEEAAIETAKELGDEIVEEIEALRTRRYADAA